MRSREKGLTMYSRQLLELHFCSETEREAAPVVDAAVSCDESGKFVLQQRRLLSKPCLICVREFLIACSCTFTSGLCAALLCNSISNAAEDYFAR